MDKKPVTSQPVSSKQPNQPSQAETPQKATESEQIVVPETKPSSRPKWIVPILIVVIIILAGVLFYVVQKSNTQKAKAVPTPVVNETTETPSTANQPETPPVQIDTSTWKTYTDTNAGFSFKYPATIIVNDANDNPTQLSLNVAVEKLSDIPEDLPMMMGRNDAIAQKTKLASGEWSDAVKIGNLYGNDEMILSRFEICSLILDRKLTFYPNDYRVMITLSAPENPVISAMPEFFTKDPANCGGNWMWNRDVFTNFESTLKNQQGKGMAQEWYNTFDEIMKSVALSAPKVVQKPEPVQTNGKTYTNDKYGFQLTYEAPYKILESKDDLSAYPNAVALIYGGGQAYDIVVDVWDTKAEYEKEYEFRLKDLTVKQVNGKYITLFNNTNEAGNEEIIDSFVETQ